MEKVNKIVTKKVTKKVVEKKISEKDLKDVLWDLQISLLESDVALETAEKICGDLKNNLIGSQIRRGKTKESKGKGGGSKGKTCTDTEEEKEGGSKAGTSRTKGGESGKGNSA